MTQFYFLILSVIVFLIIRSIVRNTNDFYSYFLIYLSFSILGQYFITDITGAQWFLVTHDKVIFEYIGFSLLIFRFGASQYNKSRKELSNINLYSFIFVLLSAIFILFSINMEASIILVVISLLWEFHNICYNPCFSSFYTFKKYYFKSQIFILFVDFL